MQTRRDFLRYAGMAGASAALTSCASLPKPVSAKKPNFVIIFADDQGYQDMGCFGSPDIRTPNFDRMAKNGMRFTDFYSASAICSPSRAALLTGRYPPRTGITRVLFPRDKKGMSTDQLTIADVLKRQGYATTCIGKWHLGHLPGYLPTDQGFDSYFGIPYSNDMTVDTTMTLAKDAVLGSGLTRVTFKTHKPKKNAVPLMRDEEIVEYPARQSLLTKRYTEEAIKFIEANRDRPFFLYLPHTMPHIPLFASKKFNGKSERGLYGDVIEEMDWSTGEIIKALRKLGIDGNTLVVYTSDNGPWLSKKAHGGSALPLRDGKFKTYEGGMREPTIMQWPGRIKRGAVCSEIAGTIDLLPTLTALAGAGLPADHVIDGRDISKLMFLPGSKTPHEAYYYYRGTRLEAVRQGKWKLRRTKIMELYDLEADVGEKNNVAEQNKDVVEELLGLMTAYDLRVRQGV